MSSPIRYRNSAWLFCLLCAFGQRGAAPVKGADQAAIRAAIDRGVAFLKTRQGQDGGWRDHEALGATALCGLALFESGVKPNDPALQGAIEFVRRQAPSSSHTYSVSLAVMFLDRLGDKNDSGLIRMLGERLRDGQCGNGSWTYDLGATTGVSLRQFANAANLGDNSNTQFAVLGTWISRKHGAQVDDALQKVADYFRSTATEQNRAAGWGYVGRGNPTPSMTCAGLLALATQHGLNSLRAGKPTERPLAGKKAPRPAAGADRGGERGAGQTALQDPLVQQGLVFIENHLNRGEDRDWYFHWSVERVGVVYDLPRIGGVDWYEWSSEIALKRQQGNGSWFFRWGDVPETAFVLLVLNRSNVARDLTGLVGSGQSQLKAGTSLADLKDRGTSSPTRPSEADSPAQDDPVDALLAAPAARQRQMIVEFKEKKGAEYSQLLTEACERLTGAMQESARAALVERFTRLTPRSLREKLTSSSAEARRAAVLAAQVKMSKELIPDLIDRLTDEQPVVGSLARDALRALTSQNLGPPENASLAERYSAAKRWRQWHETNAGASP